MARVWSEKQIAAAIKKLGKSNNGEWLGPDAFKSGDRSSSQERRHLMSILVGREIAESNGRDASDYKIRPKAERETSQVFHPMALEYKYWLNILPRSLFWEELISGFEEDLGREATNRDYTYWAYLTDEFSFIYLVALVPLGVKPEVNWCIL